MPPCFCEAKIRASMARRGFASLFLRSKMLQAMMSVNCSVLHTPTIHTAIRISQDFRPAFMRIAGGSQGLLPTYEQAHVGSDLCPLTS